MAFFLPLPLPRRAPSYPPPPQQKSFVLIPAALGEDFYMEGGAFGRGQSLLFGLRVF